MTAPRPRPPVLASRTLRARHNGQCVLCWAPVFRGQRVGKLPFGWAHTACIASDLLGRNT